MMRRKIQRRIVISAGIFTTGALAILMYILPLPETKYHQEVRLWLASASAMTACIGAVCALLDWIFAQFANSRGKKTTSL